MYRYLQCVKTFYLLLIILNCSFILKGKKCEFIIVLNNF